MRSTQRDVPSSTASASTVPIHGGGACAWALVNLDKADGGVASEMVTRRHARPVYRRFPLVLLPPPLSPRHPAAPACARSEAGCGLTIYETVAVPVGNALGHRMLPVLTGFFAVHMALRPAAVAPQQGVTMAVTRLAAQPWHGPGAEQWRKMAIILTSAPYSDFISIYMEHL